MVGGRTGAAASVTGERGGGIGGGGRFDPPSFAKSKAKRADLTGRVARAQARLQAALSAPPPPRASQPPPPAAAIAVTASQPALSRAELQALSPGSQRRYVAGLGKAELAALLGDGGGGSGKQSRRKKRRRKECAVGAVPVAVPVATSMEVVETPGGGGVEPAIDQLDRKIERMLLAGVSAVRRRSSHVALHLPVHVVRGSRC